MVNRRNEAGDRARILNQVIEMQAAGVTSVVCFCGLVTLGDRMRASSSQGFFPEWILTNYDQLHSNFDLKTFISSEHRDSIVGLMFEPRQIPVPDTPVVWAVKEVDNSYDPPNSQTVRIANERYRSLLLLSSGIQMAGPNLTPATFRAAMTRTRFPNPDHPIKAGAVGFNDGSHTMAKDAVEVWWSSTARDPVGAGGNGAFCYLEGGRRYMPGTWPAGDGGFFEPPCHAGL